MLDDLRSDRDKALDASQMKRDDFDHARESYAGLKQLAHATLNPLRSSGAEKKALKALKDPYRRVKRVNGAYPKGSSYVSEKLSEAYSWLLANSAEFGGMNEDGTAYTFPVRVPVEIEREDGRLNSGRREFNEANYGMDVCDIDSVNQSTFERMGQYYMGSMACFEELDKVADGMSTVGVLEEHGGTDYNPRFEPDTRHINIDGRPLTQPVDRTPTEVLPYCGIDGLYYQALRKRGERFRTRAEERAPKLRWRGMEEYDAVEKANEKLREGVTRKQVKSTAKTLPPVARLNELFRVQGSDLINRRLDRVVSSKQVKIDGEFHSTHRVAYALASGEDPADKVVRDGTASNYRHAEGHAFLRPEGLWQAQVWAGDERTTVGTYETEEQALAACQIYLKSLGMGLL